jgi:glycerol kinase
MATKFVGSIDQGTTSTRFILFSRDGDIISMGQKEFKQHIPEEGRTEHDPEEIWESVQYCVELALSSTNPKNTLKRQISLSEIDSVGITNQRETTVVWNRRTGVPFYRALVWMDMRSENICSKLSNEHPLGQQRFRAKTGLPVSPYFSGTKIMWLLENVPGLRDAANNGDALFGTIDSWLLWKLSGGQLHATDVTNASRTLLMDLSTLKWDEEQCKILNIPMKMLPEIRSSSEVYCTSAAKCLLNVPISGVLGDQQAALFGQAGMNPGSVKNTYGTGCFTLCNVGDQVVQSKRGLLSTVAVSFFSFFFYCCLKIFLPSLTITNKHLPFFLYSY